VAPLRLGGLRGKKSTPSVWLGGTGEFIVVGKPEREQREHQGVSGQTFGGGEQAKVCFVFLME
jgi:hypothetical protein